MDTVNGRRGVLIRGNRPAMKFKHKRPEYCEVEAVVPEAKGGVRFGSSDYANTVPLVYCLKDVFPGGRLVKRVPSAMPGMLHGDSVDVALVPVGALLGDDRLEMLPGVGVCARAAVLSVLIKLYKPLSEVRRVRMDAASRTSNALARIIFRRQHGLQVEMIGGHDGGAVDAEVMIGDKALGSAPAPCGDVDLGEAWNRLTGLPFVFAVWACRAGDPRNREYAGIVQRARDAGVVALAEIVGEESRRLGLAQELCREYLAERIHYTVGQREVEAMKLFGEMLREEGGMPMVRGDRV
jgi:chorismate dehydratase